MDLRDIPKEGWNRIISYRKINGYDYIKCETYHRTAKELSVKIPRDDEPNYIMKALRTPKAQRSNFIGVANHAGVSSYIHNTNGGRCSPK